MNCLGEWEQFLHDTSLPPLVQIALAHYQFEAIHPFLDGNGRVGRLLITLFLVERSILPAPLLYLSAFFENKRSDYYHHLQSVTESSDWAGWLEYFLSGVAKQAQDALERAERINKKLSLWRAKASEFSTKTPLLIVEKLAENPFLTIKNISEEMNIAFTTAQRSIEKLEKISVLKQVGDGKRDRVYCASDILNILENPLKAPKISKKK